MMAMTSYLRALAMIAAAVLAAGLLGLITCLPSAQATTSLTNGSFETGDITGWTVSAAPQGGSVEAVPSFTCDWGGVCSSTTVDPVDGTYFALLTPGAEGVYTTVTQTFSAAEGETISGLARFLSEESSG
jgi:hypothetical protein